MTEPFQARENRCRILARSERGIVVEEALGGFELEDLIVVVHGREMKRVSSLVTAVPEVRDSAHVGVSRRVDGRDEPLCTGFCGVCNRLADVFLRVGLTVSVRIVVSLHPVIEFQFHGVANLVLNEDLNGLLVGGCLVSVVDRSDLFALWVRGVDKVGAAPFGVWLLNMVGVSLIVGLNLVRETVGHVDVG